MLKNIKIDNIAVIEHADIEFKKGLNVLTGETGAGKSIIIDSINAVLGERTSKELIRNGERSAGVIAEFVDVSDETVQLLNDEGIEFHPDDSLVVSRSISETGRNVCKINGWPVTVSKLKEIGSTLINIHGQHDSQALLSPERHCSFIDLLADNSELRNNYKTAFKELIKVKKELDSLYDTRDEINSRLDYINFVIDEISKSGIYSGEIETLNKEKALLQNSEKVIKCLEKACSYLSGDDGIPESLSDCAKELEKASEFYDKASDAASAVRTAAYEMSECASTVRDLTETFSFNPEKLKHIDDRLDEIYRLCIKYGKDENEVLNTLQNYISEKQQIDLTDDRITALENELYELSDKVKTLSEALTVSRKKTSTEFEKNVCSELSFLDMPDVKFFVKIDETPLTSKGKDSVEFYISTNLGQEAKSISKTASGGELSRIMLAIKNVLSDKDVVPTLIFDEIDTGVSGSAAEKIALKLYEVSKGRQVICVTHLARIAAQANYHAKITKKTINQKTYTEVIPLDFESRAYEIARITAGNDITDIQLSSARELLRKGK